MVVSLRTCILKLRPKIVWKLNEDSRTLFLFGLLIFLSRVLVLFCVKKVPGIVKYYFSVFKVGPIDATRICQHCFQSSKYFLKPLSGMGFSSFHEFCFMATIESKQVPRATISVSRTERSHKEPDLVKTVVNRWYLLRFWL